MPRIQNKPPEAIQSPELALTNKLIAEFRQLWVDQLKEAGVPHVLYNRLSLVALLHLAAIVAVDAGAQPQQLQAMCLAAFNEAYQKAPRFS